MLTGCSDATSAMMACVAADAVFGRVGDGRGERVAEGVDDEVVQVPGEPVGEVGLKAWRPWRDDTCYYM